MKSEKESRIIITNLTEKDAIGWLAVLKEEVGIKGAHFELDLPDPPDLLEKEYDRVNYSFGDLDELVSDVGDYGEAQKKSHVVADLKRMKRQYTKIEMATGSLKVAIINLESASKKLK